MLQIIVPGMSLLPNRASPNIFFTGIVYMAFSYYIERINRFGIVRTLFDVLYQRINRIGYFRILTGIYLTVDKIAGEFFDNPEEFNIRFLNSSNLHQYTGDDNSFLPSSFALRAIAGGDRCCAVLANDKLASYGWYSTAPTEIQNDLYIQFSSPYVYMYNGNTASAYRGKRLHAHGMAFAAKYFSEQGYSGLVSYVDANNFDSLRSCYRLGYEKFGLVFICRFFGRYIILRTPGCRKFGLEVITKSKKDASSLELTETVKDADSRSPAA